jgi:hypothetical protein
MVVPVNRNLLLTFAVRHSKRGANLYFSRVRDSSKQRPNDPSLFIFSPEIVIKYREKGNWMNGDRRNFSPGIRYSINEVKCVDVRTYVWLAVEPNACW